MLKLNGILYMALYSSNSITENDLLPYDVVKRKDGNVYRDGDSSTLEAGTPVYSISGYAPGFRLAVKTGQEIVVYQVSRNPKASKGSDLLDIAGKVMSITVALPSSRDTLAAIVAPGQINDLVRIVLESPVFSPADQINPGVQAVRLMFHLQDGTDVGGFFWLDSGVLVPPGIQLPDEFVIAIQAAIIARGETP